jgi:diguanylate cyclase (GGDEF)-like protein/PAS domain S-box-containing protein
LGEVRRQHFGTLLKLSPQPIAILDADGSVREWNPAAADLLGWGRSEALGRLLQDMLPKGEHGRFSQLWAELPGARRARVATSDWLHRDGHSVRVEILLAPIQDRDGSFAGVVATITELSAVDGGDPDDRRSSGGRPVVIARARGALETDELTGLPGRRWLQRLLATSVPDGHQRAVAVLDLDAFALVNQDYGPDAGDDVLREFGRRLDHVREQVAVGRWQADEFVCVVDDVDAGVVMAALIERVALAAKEPFPLSQDQIRLSLSAGLATTTRAEPAGLFSAASAAMAEAKRRGRDCAVWFAAGMVPSGAGSGLRLANDLRRALVAEELRLHYQPIIDLTTNDVVGVEALVRWQRPGVGLLAPGAFIEVAERTGQIVALGEWVIRRACRTAAAIALERLAPLRVSVNVSARQLSDPGLVGILERALQDTGCDPANIVVEVTESALLRDIAAATAILETIASIGVELDLDDFGTGYSSLLYLKHFPVTRIKIDRSFVAGLGVDVSDTAIVASTIALAHSIGLTAIAEGVETPDQLTTLRQMGCDSAQGYLLSQPLPEEELQTWLAQQLPSRLLPRPNIPEGETPAESATVGHAPGVGDARVDAADRRDDAGDRRDAAGERRDDAGDLREHGADRRDHAGDVRDRVGDVRDDIADERDRLADQRDREADLRDHGASHEVPAPAVLQTPLPPTVSAHPPGGSPAAARREAALDRSEASADRDRGLHARAQAEGGRDDALTERGVEAEARRLSSLDRHQAQSDRQLSATGRRASGYDRLSGAYLRDTGVLALRALLKQTRLDQQPLTVAYVIAHAPQSDQMSQDSYFVILANAIGDSIRPGDLLIRYEPSAFVCAMPGLTQAAGAQMLLAMQGALSGVPDIGPADVGIAASLPHEAVEDLIERARLDIVGNQR